MPELPNITYRLSWEMVDSHQLWRFCNADPAFYSNTTQTVPNSQIPDEYWHPISKVTDDPWDQHSTLKRWADADEQFVRNVKLEQAEIVAPDWKPVPEEALPEADRG